MPSREGRVWAIAMGLWNFPCLISLSTASRVFWQFHSLLGCLGDTERAWDRGRERERREKEGKEGGVKGGRGRERN